jgi:uncharacterized membrane protein YcaP (DUF421 family)
MQQIHQRWSQVWSVEACDDIDQVPRQLAHSLCHRQAPQSIERRLARKDAPHPHARCRKYIASMPTACHPTRMTPEEGRSMLNELWDLVETLLGTGKDDLNAAEMAVRAFVTFTLTIAILRLGDKRIFGKGTLFDTVVAIMIGSIMSRAITGQAPLYATWVAGGVLIALHWLVAFLSYRVSWFGPLVKGNPVQLVDDGEVLEDRMREGAVTRNDLDQALRSQGNPPDPSSIESAYLERDGSISVVTARSEPKIVEVTVADGVQTVRLAIE